MLEGKAPMAGGVSLAIIGPARRLAGTLTLTQRNAARLREYSYQARLQRVWGLRQFAPKVAFLL